MARHNARQPRNRHVSGTLTEDTYQDLQAVAKVIGQSPSRIIGDATEVYLRECKKRIRQEAARQRAQAAKRAAAEKVKPSVSLPDGWNPFHVVV